MSSESSQSPNRRKLVAHYRRLEVQVTQEHIELATRADSSHCMIADALRAVLPDAKKISVDLQTIRFTDPKKDQRYTYLTPTIAQDYLVGFDQGLPMEPFTFVLHAAVQITHAGTRQRGESRPLEGVRRTRATTIPVKMGGEPMPMAALHYGPGKPPAAVTEHLAAQNEADMAPITTTESAKYNGEPAHESETVPTPTTEWERVKTEVGNVTLSSRSGNVRRYGMRQLRARNVPRGPVEDLH